MNIEIGKPFPLGSTVTESGVNFAVESQCVESIELCVFNVNTEELLHSSVLPGKTGAIRHGFIPNAEEGLYYGYRVKERGNESASEKLLIDPYAKMLSRPILFDERQYNGDSQFMMPKSVVVAKRTEKRPPKPYVKQWKRIVYEAHVKGISQCHPDVDVSEQGTYVGAAHPKIIEHIVSLGVTSVQFMPIYSFMPEPYIIHKGLTNYWGYNPVCYFAPEARYAKHHPLNEICTLVDEYHKAGLEVIIDVVFNHTAEGDHEGPQLCLRGLFGKDVYLHVQDKNGQSHYANYSGCGNTVNTSHPFMFNYILDALRYWVDEIGVDGFRFDLAPGLGREPHEFNRFSGLIKAMLQDPILKTAVLIAEPWDMGPNGYQLGAFPVPWLEVNDKYRDLVRSFWRGDDGLIGEFATRLMGSRDVFAKSERPIHSSVNCISYHDGFTLHDLVTYENKHNTANGEDNRDGHNHNLSCNYGIEGETTQQHIIALREKQKRNLFACLLFSQGTPHVVAGDELSRTQQGNNNAYCQDNEISWLNWSLDKSKQDFLSFCKYVIALRQNSKILGNMQLDDDTFCHIKNVASINWYKPDGTDKASEDWQQHHSKAFAMDIVGTGSKSNGRQNPERWLLCVNAGDTDVRFHLPVEEKGTGWLLRLDTRYSSVAALPQVCVKEVFLQQSQSLVLFSFEYAVTKTSQ